MSKTNKKERTIFTRKNDRFISSLVIIALLVVFLISFMANIRIIYTVVVALISAMATYELIHVAGGKSKLIIGIAGAVSAFTVFAVSYKIAVPAVGVLYGFYTMLMLAISVFDNKNVRYMDAVMAVFSSIFLPNAFSCIIRLNDINDFNPNFKHYEGVFMVGMCFVCSWLTDTFAYIVGSKLGKHKMCPVISPKKSVEGAIGGLVISGLFAPLLLFIFHLIGMYFWDYPIYGTGYMKYLAIIPITIAVSGVSMVGDLAASVLKRNHDIKDFSKLIPGHGGIMDRFDSCVFVFPTLYGIMYLLSL
ncbi:MAG: phosphatidate cytidylyltransferase [Clostridia bacterium]|nr:phosphatidate cytidylyltransferase [Clostridia bacterium]